MGCDLQVDPFLKWTEDHSTSNLMQKCAMHQFYIPACTNGRFCTISLFLGLYKTNAIDIHIHYSVNRCEQMSANGWLHDMICKTSFWLYSFLLVIHDSTKLMTFTFTKKKGHNSQSQILFEYKHTSHQLLYLL